MLRGMRRLFVPFAVILLLAGGFGWWWSRPERVVARRVVSLFEAAEVESTANDISRSTRGSAIEGFLAPNLSFEGPEGPTEEIDGPQSRDSIVAMYTALARYCRSISTETPEIDGVTVTGDTAQVKARLDAVIELPSNERPVDGIQHLDLKWDMIDGKWLLSSAKWKETGR